MKITGVRVDLVNVPRARSNLSALGTARPGDFGIVRIDTDAGITGLGEIATIWDSGAKALCREIRDYVGPELVGRDPLQITGIARTMRSQLQWSRHAACGRAAVEMALFDIAGKAANTPVYNLLGGMVRDRVELSMSVFMGPVEVMVDHAREYASQGFSTVKVKVGRDAEHEVQAVRAIREALGPEINIRVDANMGWSSLKEAISVIRALEPWGIHSVEQPLPPGRLQDLAELRRSVGVPIMVDEDLWTAPDALALIESRATDIFNVYVSECGGLAEAKLILDAGERAGILGAIGSMPELGIGTAAQLHLALATPNVVVPSDVCGFRYSVDDLIHERLQIEDGCILSPSGVGLGVTLDEEALQEYRREF